MSEVRKFSKLVTVQDINNKPRTLNTFTIWLVNGGVGNWIWTIIIYLYKVEFCQSCRFLALTVHALIMEQPCLHRLCQKCQTREYVADIGVKEIPTLYLCHCYSISPLHLSTLMTKDNITELLATKSKIMASINKDNKIFTFYFISQPLSLSSPYH